MVDLKEKLKRAKKEKKAAPEKLLALESTIRENDKAARDLENQAVAIDAAVFDLKAVNPHVIVQSDVRTPEQIILHIQEQGQVVADALARLKNLLVRAQ